MSASGRTTSDLVIVDSALAAFAGRDLNDNSEVRRLLATAFLPLTSEGSSILLSHHFRKPQGENRSTGRRRPRCRSIRRGTWARLRARAMKADTKAADHTFRVRLVSLGAWTPEDREDVISKWTTPLTALARLSASWT